MRLSGALKSGSVDVLTGFLGLVFLMFLDFGTKIKFDLRWFFILGGLVSFVLGLLRGNRVPRNPWLKLLLLMSGFSVLPLTLSFMGLAFGARTILVTFLVISALLVLCGINTRRNFSQDRRAISMAVLLLPIGGIVLGSIVFLPPIIGTLSNEHVNIPAPEFSLTTQDGKLLTSSELKGHVVVLAFWATWCEPCWQELPRVQSVYFSHRGNPKVLFWAVNAYAGGHTEELARSFATRMKLALPIAFTANETARRLGVDGYPALILLDGSGRVRLIHSGYDASERLEGNLSSEISRVLEQGR